MTDLQSQLAASLGPSFTIERELGGGGMSRVFLVTDAGLGRRIVVKLLPPDAAQTVSVDRFRREILFAARLQYPHIVPLLAAGEADGLPYFSMPYIDGESLRERLIRAEEMAIAEVIQLLREIASALAYAHRKGMIHRDIKPENILLTGTHAMVTDFGVAKAIDVATQNGSARLTSIGMVLGTPAYMSPEQAVGDTSTDHRADVYALGVLAYEMLMGRAPFTDRNPRAMMIAHLTEAPPPLTTRRPAGRASLASLVMRCLAKEPDDRPQSVDEVLSVLDAVVSREVAAETRRIPSIAVIPMVNTTGDSANEHFSDGLTDELIGALSSVREIAVCGRTSAFSIKGQGLSVEEIGRRLGVDNVLEGSVRRSGDRLKVRVQLVNLGGTIVWGQAFDRTISDVFEVQEEIAQAVVQALQIHLVAGRGPLVRPATVDMVAYELFLKGKAFRRQFTPGTLERAAALFEQAIARDPDYALARAWLSDCFTLRFVIAGIPADDTVQRARSLAREAVALDPQLPDAHWALGQVMFCFDLDFAGAMREFRTAVSLDPGHIDARHLLGLTLLHLGRFDDALSELRQAVAVDPLAVEALGTMTRVYQSMNEHENAIRLSQEVIDLASGMALVRIGMSVSLLHFGRYDEGLEQATIAAQGDWPRGVANLARTLAVIGREAEARAMLDALIASTSGAAPFHVAIAWTALGETDEAIRWLERAATQQDPWISALAVDPSLEALRANDRFISLSRRLGLSSSRQSRVDRACAPAGLSRQDDALRSSIQHPSHHLRQRDQRIRLLQHCHLRMDHPMQQHFVIGIAGDEEHPYVRTNAAHRLGQLPPAEMRHHDVAHQQIDGPGVLSRMRQRLRTIRRQQHAIPTAFQNPLTERTHGVVVLGEENGLRASRQHF